MSLQNALLSTATVASLFAHPVICSQACEGLAGTEYRLQSVQVRMSRLQWVEEARVMQWRGRGGERCVGRSMQPSHSHLHTLQSVVKAYNRHVDKDHRLQRVQVRMSRLQWVEEARVMQRRGRAGRGGCACGEVTVDVSFQRAHYAVRSRDLWQLWLQCVGDGRKV
jgi:hypothetical protein